MPFLRPRCSTAVRLVIRHAGPAVVAAAVLLLGALGRPARGQVRGQGSRGADTAGAPDRALVLGDSSRVAVTTPDRAFDLVPGEARTVALWFRYGRPEVHVKLADKWFRGPNTAVSRAGDRGWALYLEQYSGVLRGFVHPGPGPQGNGWNVRGFSGTRFLADDRWHHVALVQDDTAVTAYVDGRVEGRFTMPRWTEPTPASEPLRLGWDSLGVVHFVGELDEVTVWARALSAREVRRLMYRVPPRTAPGLTARWSFDRDPPGRVVDEGPLGHDGAASDVAHAQATRPLAPPFRDTWWFVALQVGAGAAALYGLVRLYARRLERRNRQLERLVDERTEALQAALATVSAQAERLRGLDEAKNRFFANVSHEFRTPLTLILGPLEGLLAGRYGALGPAVQGQHELMRRNARRLQRMVNQILDLAKVEARDLVLRARPGDLVAFARAATQAFAPLAEERQLRLAFHSELPALTVSFDDEQLEKALLNLLSNALKFTAADGEVTVTVARRGAEAEIVVRDTGVGIPAEALPHVFERFYQVESASTRRHEGTGIGLALARELAVLHGGRLTVASTPGVGSTFTLALPVAADGAPSAAPSAAPSVAPPTSVPALPASVGAVPVDPTAWPASVAVASAPAAGAADGPATEPSDDADVDRTTVLVVEDNADVRAYVRSILAPGYRVLEAANGRAGLEAARTALPDLVLADVMMPELDGLALVEALKADAETDAIPVVLLTARGRAEDHADGLRRGAEAYLPKPFDPAVLEAQVTTILTERRRLRARLQAATPAAGSPGGAVLPDAADAAGASEAGAAGLSRAAGPTDALRPGAHPSAAAHRLDGSALQSSLADALRAAAAPHLGDPDFNPEALARAVGLHYRQFARRLQAEHGTTPSRFLRTLRVERAAGLLRDGAGSVTEVAYAVGFNSLSYFNRAFRERYDVAPSEVLTAIR